MTKIVEIDQCSQCRYKATSAPRCEHPIFRSVIDEGYYIFANRDATATSWNQYHHAGRVLDNIDLIPYWCPLSDLEKSISCMTVNHTEAIKNSHNPLNLSTEGYEYDGFEDCRRAVLEILK